MPTCPDEENQAAQFKLNKKHGTCRSHNGARQNPRLVFRGKGHGTGAVNPPEINFMYVIELICRTIINLVKHVWLLPQTVALALQQRRRQLTRNQSETERLDRIRNPSKYLGR